jgi:hypothetical protein
VQVIDSRELDRLVHQTFPHKRRFSADADLGLGARSRPAVAFVHGGCDPFLDRQLDDWLSGSAAFVAVYPLLNRLCRAGALPPGDYAVTRRPPSTVSFS